MHMVSQMSKLDNTTSKHPSHIGITSSQIDEIERLFALPEHAMDDEDYQAQKDLVATLRAQQSNVLTERSPKFHIGDRVYINEEKYRGEIATITQVYPGEKCNRYEVTLGSILEGDKLYGNESEFSICDISYNKCVIDAINTAIDKLNCIYEQFCNDKRSSAEYRDGALTSLDYLEQELELLRGEYNERYR